MHWLNSTHRMDDDTDIIFDDNCYTVNQFPHNITNDPNAFNFVTSLMEESSGAVNHREVLSDKPNPQSSAIAVGSQSTTSTNQDVKHESIKSELSEINGSQNPLIFSQQRTESQISQLNRKNESLMIQKCLRCSKCPYLTLTQSRLDDHVGKTHTNSFNKSCEDLKYQCPGCQNVFFAKESMEAHLRFDHRMIEEDSQQLLQDLLKGNSSQKRIYLKNVDCLRDPVRESNNTFPSTNIQHKIFPDSVDISSETENSERASGTPSDSTSNKKSCCVQSTDMNADYESVLGQDLSSEIPDLFSQNEGREKGRPKIYIKNVDILKEPILVPTNSFTNILNVNADLSTLSLFPSNLQCEAPNTFITPTNAMLSVDESQSDLFRKQLFMKSIDVLRKKDLEGPRKSNISLHLRTVDELNLMNKNDVQNLFTPMLDQISVNSEIALSSSENSKNSDEVAIIIGGGTSDVGSTNSKSCTETQKDVMNWTSDYGFEGLESIIDSSSPISNANQKNPHFDLNTPQRSIMDDQDKDLLFVCVQEIINGNQIINEHQQLEKQTDFGLFVNSSLPHIEDQEVIEILDDLEKLNPAQEDFRLSPGKGRIYVADNLLKFDSNADETKKKSRGRPSGSKRNWVAMRNANNQKTDESTIFKCDQNCGMKFLKMETLEFHKKCHISSSPQRMQCGVCFSTDYTSWDTLHTHLWRSHKIDMDLYSCQFCDFKTPILSRLINTHVKIHSEERNFKCEQCSKGFKNNKQLKNHRRTHRQPIVNEIHKCSACNSAFSQVRSLKRHICKEKEQDRQQFSCTICGKMLSTKFSLKQHLLTHVDPSKYKCEMCPYVTNDHNAFRRHKFTHQKSIMYNCKFCDYKCIQSNLYQKHILKEHPKEADKIIFKCTTCSFSTINQVKYSLHVAKHGDTVLEMNTSADIDQSRECIPNAAKEISNVHYNNVSTKIKVKSDLVLTDPAKFIPIGQMHLQPSEVELT